MKLVDYLTQNEIEMVDGIFEKLTDEEKCSMAKAFEYTAIYGAEEGASAMLKTFILTALICVPLGFITPFVVEKIKNKLKKDKVIE